MEGINVHGVGIYFKNFFDPEKDFFHKITQQHVLQELTESNKPGVSYRKGIYITHVHEGVHGTEFRLMRCSTNLKGPTENIRSSDHEIITRVNEVARKYYPEGAPLNHVLAQLYENKVIQGKEKKARIKAHSDKTKDMFPNGLMAFCTFYDSEAQREDSLCRLRFRLKGFPPRENCDPELKKEIDILLHPNSLFLMPLSTNRLYTHDVSPSRMNVAQTPTRLGYVIRSSNVRARHVNGKTYIVRDNGTLIEMKPPTLKDREKIKELYKRENSTADLVEYGPIHFSLNEGDYMEPVV